MSVIRQVLSEKVLEIGGGAVYHEFALRPPVVYWFEEENYGDRNRIASNEFGWAGLFITVPTITLLHEGNLLEVVNMWCVTNLLPTPIPLVGGWHQYGICADVIPSEE